MQHQLKSNSSNVPEKFDPTDKRIDPIVRKQAHDLFDALEAEQPVFPGSAEIAAQLETQFVKCAHYVAWAVGELARRIENERKGIESK